MYGLWKEGGGAEGWGTGFLVAIGIVWAVDMSIRVIFRDKIESKERAGKWYLCHAIINLCITVTAFPDLWEMIVRPSLGLTNMKICSVYPLALNQALHLYHCLVYFADLTWLDVLHHLIMTFIAVPLVFIQDGSLLINASHVFVTGFPGAVSYMALSAYCLGFISRSAEKLISRWTNLWIRSPGLLFCVCFAHIQAHFIHDALNSIPLVQFCALYLNLFIYYWNAQYFLDLVISSY